MGGGGRKVSCPLQRCMFSCLTTCIHVVLITNRTEHLDREGGKKRVYSTIAQNVTIQKLIMKRGGIMRQVLGFLKWSSVELLGSPISPKLR